MTTLDDIRALRRAVQDAQEPLERAREVADAARRTLADTEAKFRGAKMALESAVRECLPPMLRRVWWRWHLGDLEARDGEPGVRDVLDVMQAADTYEVRFPIGNWWARVEWHLGGPRTGRGPAPDTLLCIAPEPVRIRLLERQEEDEA